MIEMGIHDEKAEKREDHKKGRLNYTKANFAELVPTQKFLLMTLNCTFQLRLPPAMLPCTTYILVKEILPGYIKLLHLGVYP